MGNATSQRSVRSELAKVAQWRRECLIEAGYERKAAAILADRVDVDLHAAVALVRRGCPSATAVRILV